MSLLDNPGRAADHRVTIAQIGKWTRMNLGARDYVHDDKNGHLWFSIGRGGKTGRKAIIVLNGLDLYDVEIGRTKKFEWVSEAVETNIGADQLSETLLRMHGQVTDRNGE